MPPKKENDNTNRKLTKRSKLFAQEYPKDLNGTQAAIRAGFSEKTAKQQAHRLLSTPAVQYAIAEVQKEREERTKIDLDFVLETHAEIVQRCMQHRPVKDSQGNQAFVETPNGEEAAAYVFNAHGATNSLKEIAKLQGMYPAEKKEVSGPNGGPVEHSHTHQVIRQALDELEGKIDRHLPEE